MESKFKSKDPYQALLKKPWVIESSANAGDFLLTFPDGSKTLVHRVVLCANTDYFSQFFKKNPDIDQLQVPFGNSSTFSSILLFLYQRKVKLPENFQELETTFAIAKFLHLQNFMECFTSKGAKRILSSNSYAPDYWLFFNDPFLSDIDLECEGSFLKGHKILLSNSSMYFRSLFQWGWKDSSAVVKIQDCKFKDLEKITKFIYSGQLHFDHADEAIHYMKFADYFQIPSLTDACEDYLSSEIHVDTVCDLYNLSYEFHLEDLKSSCQKFLAAKLWVVSFQDSFEKLAKQPLLDLITSGRVDAVDDILIKLLTDWCEVNAQGHHTTPKELLEEFLPPRTLFNAERRNFLLGNLTEDWMQNVK